MRHYTSLTTLLLICLFTTSCSWFKHEPKTALNTKQICQNLHQQLSVNTGHNINMPNNTPTEKARLYREYNKYQCEEVLSYTQNQSSP